MSSSLITPTRNHRSGGDQARALRSLARRHTLANGGDHPANRRCQTIVVSGGKGGVGRSVIALNLAIAFAQRGKAVGLVDACPDLGNIELLCGLNGYWNLSHAALGARLVDEITLVGPAGVNILSGACCLTDPATDALQSRDSLFVQLSYFERQLDWLIVDASGGSSSLTRRFASAADDLLIVATPEPTAVAEAYASVKSFATSAKPRMGLLVNQADSAPQAQQILDRLQQAAHSFLQVDLHRRGYVPRDNAIPASVNSRIPFAIQSPKSPAAIALDQLAHRWTRLHPADDDEGFFSRIRKG